MTLSEIEKDINSTNWSNRENAFEACFGRSDIPLELIEKGMSDKNHDVRISAYLACTDRTDVPLVLLEKGLRNIKEVRIIVSQLLFNRNYEFPLIRTVEPADRVYKKCRNNVIVIAEIPKTAQIRGCINKKCRASEAIIVDIIPNEDGYDKAFSIWDGGEIRYKIGNHIIINNFDHALNEPSSSGYHFYNSIEELW